MELGSILAPKKRTEEGSQDLVGKVVLEEFIVRLGLITTEENNVRNKRVIDP